jgi:hypothetical protein
LVETPQLLTPIGGAAQKEFLAIQVWQTVVRSWSSLASMSRYVPLVWRSAKLSIPRTSSAACKSWSAWRSAPLLLFVMSTRTSFYTGPLACPFVKN